MTTPGIDIIRIGRIEKSLTKAGFKEKVFGSAEIAEQELRGNKPQGYAACFAAKEAFSKAVGSGISGFSHSDVQLLHKENGAPYLSLSGNAKRENARFSVSISHDGDYAVAIVIMECEA